MNDIALLERLKALQEHLLRVYAETVELRTAAEKRESRAAEWPHIAAQRPPNSDPPDQSNAS